MPELLVLLLLAGLAIALGVLGWRLSKPLRSRAVWLRTEFHRAGLRGFLAALLPSGSMEGTVADLQAQITAATIASVRTSRAGQKIPPTLVVLGCSSKDLELLSGAIDVERELNDELALYLGVRPTVRLRIEHRMTATPGVVEVLGTDYGPLTQVLEANGAGAPTLPLARGALVRSGQRLEFFPEATTFGRGEACTHTLRGDAHVSTSHAEVVADGVGWRIKDLNSTNGTWVNGRRVADAMLSEGDVVRIGRSSFTVSVRGHD